MSNTNTPALPDKKYNIIYADPPWSYRDTLGGNAKMGAMPYPTMTQDEINALPVQSIAAKDCVLFMWATMPKLQEALDSIKAWGFTYKTCAFCWVKQNPSGNGIFAGLGRPSRVSKSVKQIVMAPRRAHSQKPDEVRDRIVELMGDLPRIELFARSGAEGWDCWGNEAPNQPEEEDAWMQ